MANAFPKIRILSLTKSKLKKSDFKERYKAYRNASSNFIKKPSVRDYIFTRDQYRCVYCGSEDNLQIDHRLSVYSAALNFIDIEYLNSPKNLQTLCSVCNAAKYP